jgi:hypothetical protein
MCLASYHEIPIILSHHVLCDMLCATHAHALSPHRLIIWPPPNLSSTILIHQSHIMFGDTFATSFTGVGADECGKYGLADAVNRRRPLDCQIVVPRCIGQCEWNKKCQTELLLLNGPSHDDTCLFGDINSFWRADLQPTIKALLENSTLAMEVLAPVVASGNAISPYAHCLRHGRLCKFRAGRRHTGGTSCTAFSNQGARRAGRDPSIVMLMAWIAMRHATHTNRCLNIFS